MSLMAALEGMPAVATEGAGAAVVSDSSGATVASASLEAMTLEASPEPIVLPRAEPIAPPEFSSQAAVPIQVEQIAAEPAVELIAADIPVTPAAKPPAPLKPLPSARPLPPLLPPRPLPPASKPPASPNPTAPIPSAPAPSVPGTPKPGTPKPGTPAPTTPAPTAPTPSSPTAPAPTAEERVLVSEVVVEGVDGSSDAPKLRDAVYDAIRTQPGQPATSSQLQADLNAVFATGFFAKVDFRPEDTPLGVRVTFVVTPNPVLKSVKAEGVTVLKQPDLDRIFTPYYGKILNFNELQVGVKELNKFYQDKGYILAQVVDATQVSPDGQVTLAIAEGIVDGIQVQFLNADRQPTNTDKDGKEVPVKGRTKPYIITREFSLKPGDVFNRNEAQKSLERLSQLGLFQDASLAFQPSPNDPRKVIIVANVVESNSGSIGASGGLSSSSGLFGSVTFGQDNFRGQNQKLRSEVTLGQKDFSFDVGFTDPWIKNDPFRTGYSVNLFRRRSISLIYSGGDTDINLPNGDTPRLLRLGGGVEFTRPLSKNVFEPSEWTGSLGVQYQRVGIRDKDGKSAREDSLGNDLTFSGKSYDDLLTVRLGLARDRRDNKSQTLSGAVTRFSVEQSVPLGAGSILMNRVRASHSQYIPVRFLKFTEGCRKPKAKGDCPQTMAFNVQAGTILGELPPYEAFALGGSSSVRGWREGEVGSGRTFIQGTAEYRFPVFSFVGGALFADFASDIGSGNSVPGNPAGVRDKPGSGYGVGIGVRVKSPLGPIRVDYTVLSNGGDQKFQFGIGERF
jgi:outer membrane protein insertion porin family